MRIGIVAGEASGDILGASLLRSLKQQVPDMQIEGIGGPRMMAEGCRSLFAMEYLSVMGLVEVLGRLPQLLSIRRQLIRHFIANPPDVFIGVDAPDFNLGLEKALKAAGIPTVHFVSPSVWAWRQYRVRKIVKSTDLMLTLFPFEAAFYRKYQMPVKYVGHPLADQIPLETDQQGARAQLALPSAARVVAVLPGSRGSELKYLADVFIKTMLLCQERAPELSFVVPLVNPRIRGMFEQALLRNRAVKHLLLLDGQSHQAMAAADVVLLASGTAALECMLLKRPMVVSAKVAPLSAWLLRRLIKVPYVSLPNNLAGEMLVEEYLQERATPEHLAVAVERLLQQPAAAQRLIARFAEIHHSLRCNAGEQAARAVLALLSHPRAS